MNEVPKPPLYDVASNTANTSVTINGGRINYTLVAQFDNGDNALAVEVENPGNQDEINNVIVDSLQSRYWFLSPEYASQTVRERFDVELAEGVHVGLYNFQERDLLPEEVSAVGSSLAKFYTSLQDKTLWTLESVQVEARDIENSKNGEPLRGLEVPAQRRFKLFPASFAKGQYRDVIDCSWLEGSTIHETTHVTIEPTLRTLWNEHEDALGWRDTEDATIELPGGATTRRYNTQPSHCASSYGALAEDDDRAESVVLYLVDPAKLEGTRAGIISQVCDKPSDEVSTPIIMQQPAELPKLDSIQVAVIQKTATSGFFEPKGERRGKPKPIMSLQIFREQHSIA